MDLLDSILSGMEKPPTIRKPVIKDKEKREKYEKLQKERQEAAKKEKEMLDSFRKDFSRKIKSFVTTPTNDDIKTYRLQLKPMNKFYRSIVREVCETEEYEQEIVVHSFGTEEVDRHCIVWKKGYEPCDDELRAMKLGVEYKPPKDDEVDEDDGESNNDQPQASTIDGKDKFWSKYEKIIGENASGVESARIVMPAKQYGCVPIENKKDQRSIEQMIDDIRKTKKQKIANDESDSNKDPQSSSSDKLLEQNVADDEK